jgi:hypothetical protein
VTIGSRGVSVVTGSMMAGITIVSAIVFYTGARAHEVRMSSSTVLWDLLVGNSKLRVGQSR